MPPNSQQLMGPPTLMKQDAVPETNTQETRSKTLKSLTGITNSVISEFERRYLREDVTMTNDWKKILSKTNGKFILANRTEKAIGHLGNIDELIINVTLSEPKWENTHWSSTLQSKFTSSSKSNTKSSEYTDLEQLIIPGFLINPSIKEPTGNSCIESDDFIGFKEVDTSDESEN